MSYIIKGDSIVFKNHHNNQDITLVHSDSGYDLIFGTTVVFSATSTHQTVRLGDFDLTLSDDKDSLVVKKDGLVKFKISD